MKKAFSKFGAVVEGELYLTNTQTWDRDAHTDAFHEFRTESLKYLPHADDFGPMSMGCVIRFIEMLEREQGSRPSKKIVYCVKQGRRALTNGAFLLGCYLIIARGFGAVQVLRRFEGFGLDVFEPFRDASSGPVDFVLSLLDCWRSVEHGREIGWIGMPKQPDIWGMIDIVEYEHYANPLNGDLVQVVPGKLIAFRGPENLGGDEYRDIGGHRKFSPKYYVAMFQAMRISTVIGLDDDENERTVFEAQGIRRIRLQIEDTASLVRSVGAIPGTGISAIHCKDGFGRTGTLVAAYLIKQHRFRVREAIAWVRIMRPGSIVGAQVTIRRQMRNLLMEILHFHSSCTIVWHP
mmetsp:Transcript_52794/g.138914  ORF Transcript_52794/g.138914 Transcript_52794/m.138914 type:complete len:349 (-) Transcript_52794:2051-3097(-)